MTKNELIGSVLLRVGGGRATSDMSVREADVRTLIAPAMNLAIEAGDNMNRNEEADRDYLTEFYGTYQNVTIDRTNRIPTFAIAEATVPLKGNGGLRAVYDNCGTFYGKLTAADRASVVYYSGLTPGMAWYFRLGDTVQLYGVNPIAETVNYDALVSVDAIGDDDQLPLVAGTEAKAIDVLFQMVMGQIANPYDSRIDKDDINRNE